MQLSMYPNSKNHKTLFKTFFETPLGQMLAIADEQVLYLLEFTDCKGLDREIDHLMRNTRANIILGQTAPLISIQHELVDYFKGNLIEFQTPTLFTGTSFQAKVWEYLKQIPFGETRSYSEIAQAIVRPTAFRAVANANGANQLAIIIPCHRVINANGKLGGYAGGLSRKKWLLDLEKSKN